MRETSLKNIDIDGDARIAAHSRILKTKPMLQKVFAENFRVMLDGADRWFSATGERLELGSGAVSIKAISKDIITSDIVPSQYNDLVLDGQDMSFEDDSLAVIFAQNVFHHFNDPEKFLSEASRTLKNGGGIVLLEPYHGPLASFIYKFMITEEDFDKSQRGWKSDTTGPMLDANQALSFIVFDRDYETFRSKFPEFELVSTEIRGNYLRYILSGGLNFKSLTPSWMEPVLTFLEGGLSPFRRLFGIHHIIFIRKCN